MKKNFFRMFAAIQPLVLTMAFCGAIATVFTACNKDDDDSPAPTPTPQPETPSAYTVTLDFVMHEKTFDMMTVDFIYTDAKGNETTMKIDKSTPPNAQLTALEKDFFDNNPTLALWRNEETEQRYPGINDYLDTKHLKVYRVTLENVAVGSTIKTTALPHILDSFQPKEENDYALMPVVLISRSNADKFMTAHSVSVSFFSAKNWEKLKEMLNSKELAYCMNTVVVN